MFGGKGAFSDDILSNFISSNTKPVTKKSYSNNPSEEKQLLSTVKQGTNYQDDYSDPSKKSPVVKTTASLAQNHVVKKNQSRGQDIGDTVEDLLNEIEQTKKIEKKPPRGNQASMSTGFKDFQSGSNALLDDLVEDEEEVDLGSTYNPTTRDTPTAKRPNTSAGLTDEMKNKKRELFGLNQSGASHETDITQKARPGTSETKPITTMTEDVGEINITVSRRKGRGQTQKDPRPFTSPGLLENRELGQLSADENKSMTDIGGGQITPGDFRNIGDEEDAASTSEYLSQIGGRGTRRGNTLQPKMRIDVSHELGGGIRELTPKKSPVSAHEGASTKEQFFSEKTVGRFHQDLTPQAMPNRNSLDLPNTTGISRRNRPQESKRSDLPGTSNLNEFNQKHLSPPHVDTQIGRNDPITNQQDPSLKGYFRESEDLYKKRIKETEEYYENRYNQLKTTLEDEKKKWEQAHQKEIELLKKERDEMKENMNVTLDRERQRLQELYKLEIESKEKLHKYELERQKHIFEEQNESLKRQIEAQAKLNILADEIRASSSKVAQLSDKLEQDKAFDENAKRQELYNKEKQLEDKERKLNHERELIEAERRRLDKMKSDTDARELEMQRNLEKERELLKSEYNRLSELQEAIRNMESDKKKDLEAEKKILEQKKIQIEKENLQIKEEYNKKYHELELQTQLFETRKREIEEMLEKSEETLKKRHDEVDNLRKRLALHEAESIRKLKSIEQKELMVSKLADEVQTKSEILQMEKLAFEKEKIRIQELATKAKDESDFVNKFKREFDLEKERNARLKLELDKYGHELQNERKKIEDERNNLNIMHKTLEGMRYTYVKEISNTGGEKTPKETKAVTREGFFAAPNHKRSGSITAAERDNATFEAKARATFSEKKKTEEKFVLLKDVKRTDLRPSAEGGNDLAKYQSTSVKGFNLKTYMDHLKEYDQYTSTNQNYITHEKEGLLKNKIENDTGNFIRLKGLSGDLLSRQSPRYKASLFSNGLDSLQKKMSLQFCIE